MLSHFCKMSIPSGGNDACSHNDISLHQEARQRAWDERGIWQAKWVTGAEPLSPPDVLVFRNRFAVPHEETLRIHVTADERYELYLDGKRIGRGPERGDRHHWFFETYDLPLTPDEHVLVARVWVLGENAPVAQMSLPPQGLVVCADDPRWHQTLTTGVATWEYKQLQGFILNSAFGGWFTGATLEVDGHHVAWGWERGEGDGWQRVQVCQSAISYHRDDRLPEHVLEPASLPPMLERPWQGATVRFVAPLEAVSTAVSPSVSLNTCHRKRRIGKTYWMVSAPCKSPPTPPDGSSSTCKTTFVPILRWC